MSNNGGQPTGTANHDTATANERQRRRRRHREPYAWLGVGALSLGFGAAALGTGSGIALADESAAGASAPSSQSDSAPAANANGGKGSAKVKSRGSTNRASAADADDTKYRNRPATLDSNSDSNTPSPAAANSGAKDVVRANLPEAAAAPAALSNTAAPTNTAAPAVAPVNAPSVRSLPAILSAVTADATAALPSIVQPPQALLAPVQAVFNLLGGLPTAPFGPAATPVLSLLFGAFRRNETSQTSTLAAAATAVGTAQSAAATAPPSVTHAVTNDWGSGHNSSVTVKAGDTALNGWTVEFDSPADISNIWNAQITSHVGTHYVISNMPYNAKVASGQTTSFGYQASGSAAAGKPTNLKINGVGSTNPPAAPTVSIADATVAEGNSGTSNAAFTVTLSSASTTPVTVGYATSNGTATAGSDFTAASGTLTFAPGVTSQTVTVKVTGDTAVEANETFNVALSNPSGVTVARGTAVGTITNDDVAPAPTISIADASVAEGNSGTSNASFTVTLSNASTTPVTVGYTTSNGTATAGTDFTAASGTVTFAPGTTSQTITVKVTGDTAVEANETFNVALSSPTGGTISRSTALGTITNDDVAPAPSITISDASVAEGNSGTSNATFTVTLSSASTTPVTVAYATTNGTATAGADYTAASGTLTFAPGTTSQTITVKVAGDTTVESNETFSVALSSPTGATIARATALGTITNDDTAPPTQGGAAAAYTVTNDWGTGHNASIVVTAGSSALNGWTVEFDTPADIVNVWNAKIVSHVGTHYVISNLAYNAAVAANQSTSFGYQATPGSVGSTPTNIKVNGVSVTNPPATPTISIADASVAEGNTGTRNAAFTVTLSGASTNPVTVNYTTTNGTATAGSDYTATTGTVTFAPGVTSQTINVSVIGDTTAEANETFNVALSSPSGAAISRTTAIGTITNDDSGPTPGLSISDASATEPGSGGMAPGFLKTSGNQILDSQGKPVQLAGVNWFGAQSSNGVPDGLWTRNYKEMIDQMAGQGFNTIRIPYASALLHTNAAPSGINYYANPDLQGLSRMQVLDKIIDYAGQQGMRVILDHHRSTEGAGTSENGLWYDSQYTEDAWVADWQTLATRYKNNPTVIGFDLHNEPYNGTWGGGGANDWARAAERAGNASLAINPDLLIFVEGVGSYKGDSYWWGGQLQGVKDRPIQLNVANRVVYSPHDYPNSVWQQPWFQGDNFGAGLPAKFRSEWGYIYEQNIAPIYIGEFGTKLIDPKDAVWLEAITSYMSGDFDNNGTIDIPAGTEDMSWTFWSWNPNSGDTGGILADDWRTINQNKMVYLKPIQYTGGNGTALATFTVTLAAPSTQTVTVQYATSNGTATAGSDYTATSGTVTFAPGETQKTISVAIRNDSATEGNENFTVLLSNPVGANLTDASGAGTILDRVGTS